MKGSCRSAASHCCRSPATSQGFGHPRGICSALPGVGDSGERSHLANGSEQVEGNSSKPWSSWLTESLPPQYIVLFVAKVLLGQVQEVNDVREYDVEDSKKARKVAKKKEAGLQLHNALKEGYVGRGG